jgi:hypothetical protein
MAPAQLWGIRLYPAERGGAFRTRRARGSAVSRGRAALRRPHRFVCMTSFRNIRALSPKHAST